MFNIKGNKYRLDCRNRLQKLTPVEVLKNLMTENGMNTSDLGAVLGSRGLASEVLNGKRGLRKTLIAKLAKRFRVDPGLFLEAVTSRAGGTRAVARPTSAFDSDRHFGWSAK